MTLSTVVAEAIPLNWDRIWEMRIEAGLKLERFCWPEICCAQTSGSWIFFDDLEDGLVRIVGTINKPATMEQVSDAVHAALATYDHYRVSPTMPVAGRAKTVLRAA